MLAALHQQRGRFSVSHSHFLTLRYESEVQETEYVAPLLLRAGIEELGGVRKRRNELFEEFKFLLVRESCCGGLQTQVNARGVQLATFPLKVGFADLARKKKVQKQ